MLNHLKERKTFKWGTNGKDGKSPLKWILLKDLTTCHIHNILFTCPHITTEVKYLFNQELQYRVKDGFFVDYYEQ